MFEFLEFFVEIFALGAERKNPRAVFLIVALVIVGIISFLVFFTGSSGDDGVSHADVEAEIKKIDKAIVEFYRKEFTLPENVNQLIEYEYIEPNKKVWKNWKISFEGYETAITAIKAVSTSYDERTETIRYDCVEKMFDE